MDTTALRHQAADEQGRRLVAAATAVLPAFGLDGGRVTLASNEFNATCRVEHADGVFALRLNTASPRTQAEVAGEVAWVRALAEDGVAVALPRAHVGDEHPTVRVEGVDDPVPVVVHSWLDGPDLGEIIEDDPAVAVPWLRGLGRVMARLHEHARDWPLPHGATRPTYDSVMLGFEDRLSEADGPWRTPAVDEAVRTAQVRVAEDVGDVLAEPSGRHLLHADLHMWNAKPGPDGRPAVFDFDDAGTGHPLLDLAIAVFYLRDDERLETALLDGLGASGPEAARLVDAVGSPRFEAMVAGRQLLLLDDVTCNPIGPPPGLDVTEYAARVAARLEHWLGTGRFTLVPPDGSGV